MKRVHLLIIQCVDCQSPIPDSIYKSLRLAIALVLFTPLIALAYPNINPGETLNFSQADGGVDECRRGVKTINDPPSSGPQTQPISCQNSFQGETIANPGENKVETSARTNAIDGTIGIPFYASARVYNDFFIPGTPGTVVEVQFNIDYDFSANMASGGMYTIGNTLSLRIQDRTFGTFVASHELEGMQRSGDQGLTDIGLSQERAAFEGQKGQFTVKLRRGGLYRVHFELESAVLTFIIGLMRADAVAKWNNLSVTIEEDEVELLTTHDNAVRSELKTHDEDIKDMLTGLKERQEEIIRLLLTPQGRRNSDLGSFPLK